MIIINTQSDLDVFQQQGNYPGVFADYLQARFIELKGCMEEFFEGEGEFSLEEFGPLYVLQKTDNLRDLSEVGFNACDNGIFGDVPEEVSLIQAPDFSFYEVQIAFNNSFLPHFYLPVGQFEEVYPELQDYLKRWLHVRKPFYSGV